MNFKVIIFVVGKGIRMKFKYLKVIYKVCGKEMVNYIIDVLKKLGVKDIVVILGYEVDVVKEKFVEEIIIVM